MTVAYTEVHGSPTENSGTDGFSATMVLRVAWEDRYSFIDEWLFTFYPHKPETLAWCRNCNIHPAPGRQEGSDETAAYQEALITANFDNKSEVPIEGNVQESIEPSIEFMTVDHKGFKWGSTEGPALLEAEAPGKLLPSIVFVFTQYRMIAVPPAALLLFGCVNDAPMVFLTPGYEGWIFAPETLLFLPPSINRSIDTSGVGKLDITYRLSYRPNWDPITKIARGWNWFWRKEIQKYEQIYTSEGVYKNYPTADFTVL